MVQREPVAVLDPLDGYHIGIGAGDLAILLLHVYDGAEETVAGQSACPAGFCEVRGDGAGDVMADGLGRGLDAAGRLGPQRREVPRHYGAIQGLELVGAVPAHHVAEDHHRTDGVLGLVGAAVGETVVGEEVPLLSNLLDRIGCSLVEILREQPELRHDLAAENNVHVGAGDVVRQVPLCGQIGGETELDATGDDIHFPPVGAGPELHLGYDVILEWRLDGLEGAVDHLHVVELGSVGHLYLTSFNTDILGLAIQLT